MIYDMFNGSKMSKVTERLIVELYGAKKERFYCICTIPFSRGMWCSSKV